MVLLPEGAKRLSVSSHSHSTTDQSDTLGGPSIRDRPFSTDTTDARPHVTINDAFAPRDSTGIQPRGSRRYRDSVHAIPTPDVEIRRPPRFEPFFIRSWVVLSIASEMVVLAIVIEVAVFLSQRNNGFHVPQKNVISFATPQFLISFFPTLLVAPLAYVWTVIDWQIRYHHPYVTLHKGGAPAEESVLLDYISMNKILAFKTAARYKHKLVFVSMLTAFGTYLFQPLAGAFFELRQALHEAPTTVTSTQQIGLSPDIADLNGFLAAAGFAEAAVFHNLDDPPFVEGGWATAQFQYPQLSSNDLLVVVNTTGVKTIPNCFAADSQITNVARRQDGSTSGNITIQAVGTNGNLTCKTSAQIDPNDAESQYGSVVADCTDSGSSAITSSSATSTASATAINNGANGGASPPYGFPSDFRSQTIASLPVTSTSFGTHLTTVTDTSSTAVPQSTGSSATAGVAVASSSLGARWQGSEVGLPKSMESTWESKRELSSNQTFGPVLFWYFRVNAQGQNQAKAVYCAPAIEVFNVQASVSVANSTLVNVTSLSTYTPSNNVTGSPQDGQAFNGLIFGQSSDKFVNARATAIGSGVPGAVFRFASQSAGGADGAFASSIEFLNLTETVYTRFLSISAQSTYFVPAKDQLNAVVTSDVPRLFIQPLAGHGLAIFLALVGGTGIVVHLLHRRRRQGLYLTAPPGSIAAISSLTSRSGFGELLLPYDDAKGLSRKLHGLRFRLDKRTGAIVADDHMDLDGDLEAGTRSSSITKPAAGPGDEMRMGLLAPETRAQRPPLSAQSTTSSFVSVSREDPWEREERRSMHRSAASADSLVTSARHDPMGLADGPYQWEPFDPQAHLQKDGEKTPER